MEKNKPCCAPKCCDTAQSFESQNSNYPSWVVDEIDTPIGKIPRIKTQTEFSAALGALKVRLGINRDNYKVPPGLYAVGDPTENSPVLSTANYKLTFDVLRKELTGQNLWIIVLDTRGINVWCAAGKGTFGTAELIRRIELARLEKVVSHKNIILPQLGAPGVAAHEVRKNTGFKVTYGPVYAKDLPAFLQNGQATTAMRKVHFTLVDRLIVIPVELNYIFKVVPALFILFLLFNLASPGEFDFVSSFMQSVSNLVPYVIAIVLGTVGIAALLPYIPFRSFAAKGLLLGLAWSAFTVRYHAVFNFPENSLVAAANILFLTALTSFFALNFTGSTTYTSVSGVQKETLYTIPLIAVGTLIGLGLAIAYKIMLFRG
ncbi:mercury methylation corrinoid protein HgcA [Dethiobacter alkaliphilus]|uniref:mercury methylation corrinoid protein HgcA n=1 Tax=Dethiobacter alkaliphilus TaxID=427926 RepID=UPI002227135C|nr:mercury methylation corrinoid protein HgcA [Dethiobacter alkaliphilus]MCW3489045.1 mercury methylation corrinoid protein HgcA [Dethiobacter alkaliphilus]